mmetsp:Transcript_5362/g.11868  ORF Transcript_5362/g.11868 Transcript_5362/m.11868 type:complete len:221 (+) Transcript_5362:424-1086(+)
MSNRPPQFMPPYMPSGRLGGCADTYGPARPWRYRAMRDEGCIFIPPSCRIISPRIACASIPRISPPPPPRASAGSCMYGSIPSISCRPTSWCRGPPPPPPPSGPGPGQPLGSPTRTRSELKELRPQLPLSRDARPAPAALAEPAGSAGPTAPARACPESDWSMMTRLEPEPPKADPALAEPSRAGPDGRKKHLTATGVPRRNALTVTARGPRPNTSAGSQ